MKWMIVGLLAAFTMIGPVQLRAEDTSPAVPANTAAQEKIIAAGMKVKVDYTLTVDGKVVESSKDQSPLEYTQGDENMIPGFTQQMEGLKVGDEKTFSLTPEEGYGMVDPQAIQEVPKSAIGSDIQLSVGLELQMNDPQGNAYPAVVKEIKEDKVVLDFNHPLAGKSLTFNVKVVDIQ